MIRKTSSFEFECEICGWIAYCATENIAIEAAKKHKLTVHISKQNSAWNTFYETWKATLQNTQHPFCDLKEESFYSSFEYAFKKGYAIGLNDALENKN